MTTSTSLLSRKPHNFRGEKPGFEEEACACVSRGRKRGATMKEAIDVGRRHKLQAIAASLEIVREGVTSLLLEAFFPPSVETSGATTALFANLTNRNLTNRITNHYHNASNVSIEHLECRLEANRNTTKYRVNNRLSSNERFFQKIFEQYLQKKRKRGRERGCKEESDIEKEGSKTGGIRKFTILPPPPPSSIIFDSANGHTMGALRTRYSVHGSLRVFRAHPLALRMIHAVVIQRGGGGGWLRLNEEIMTNLAATSLLPPPSPSLADVTTGGWKKFSTWF